MTNSIKTVNAELLELPMVQAMHSATPLQVGAMKKRIADAIDARKEADADAFASKDWKHLESWNNNDALARFFLANEIDPRGYIMQPFMSDAEIIKRGFHPVARTKNLKAYKKVFELANYVVSGQSKFESVFKTFVACTIQASKYSATLPRDVCKRFLSSIDLSFVSADLADAVRDLQAKHMTEGADTQTSQMTLTLASLGCGTLERVGRSKEFTLNAESPIIEALAIRFGMTEQLDAVKQRAA